MPLIVGIALLGLGILRLSLRAMAWLNRIVADYQTAYLAAMGFSARPEQHGRRLISGVRRHAIR